MNTPSVIAVLDKAFWFMAAFWATVGCPDRRQLANAFANMTDEQRRGGLKIRRSNVEKIAKHVNDEHVANREVTFTETGDVPEEFLQAEETLPFNLLEILRTVCLSCFGLKTSSAWTEYEGQTFVKDGNPLGTNGVRFIRMETSFMMPRPWQICKNYYGEISEEGLAQSTNEAKILQRMENIAGHYLGKGYVGDPYFSNPDFTEGMGDDAASQILYLFSDGSCTFIVNGGRAWCQEGICMEPSSEFRIHTGWIPRDIDVTRRITSCRQAILLHLASPSSFSKRNGKKEVVPNGGWILSECLSLPENLAERDVDSLSNDSSLWWGLVMRGDMPKIWLLDPDGTIRRLRYEDFVAGERYQVLVEERHVPQPLLKASQLTIFLTPGLPSERIFATGTVYEARWGMHFPVGANEDRSYMVYSQGSETPLFRTSSQVASRFD